MKKRAQFNLPLVTLIILFILLIFLSFLFFKSIQDDKENINNLKDLTRMEQIDDSIQHNISLTNNLPNCQDECSARGLKKCFGIGYKICGNFDSDSCYEWSSINSCGSNEECSSGRCKSVQQEDVSSTENPPTASATRYDFDEIELLSVEQFNVKKIADVANTWADAISGTINNLEVTHAIFNLKRDGKIMKDKEEYIKIKGENGEKKFLYNSGGGFDYLEEGLKSTKKQFWSAKQLIGDDVVKDETPPVYSAVLWETLDKEDNLVSAKLAFSDDGLNFNDWSEKYFNWEMVPDEDHNKQAEENFSDVEFKLVKPVSGEKITLAYISYDLDMDFLLELAQFTFGGNSDNGLISFVPFSEFENSFEIIALKTPSDYEREKTIKAINYFNPSNERVFLIDINTNLGEGFEGTTSSIGDNFKEVNLPILNNTESQYLTFNLPRLFVHEMGHAIGDLGDEYPYNSLYSYNIQKANIVSDGCPKWCSGELNSESPNYNQYIELRSKCITPYINNLGLLEVPEGEIRKQFDNCLGNYLGYFNWDIGKDCLNNTGCFFSAAGILEWRSQENTIMRDSSNPEATFGAVSEQHLRTKLCSILDEC